LGKQVGQAVSGKRGTMFTVCVIISSVGSSVPGVYIFLRAIFHDSLMFVAPPESLGLVNSPQSSWITRALFLKVFKRAKKHTRRSYNFTNGQS
jgi:hypothetical protein